MNFLSHFYFDRYTIDPLQVVGIVLPDLIKNARKDWNIHPEKQEFKFLADDNLTSIIRGWKRHLKVDKHFHCSNFFKQHTNNIRTAIVPILENSPARPSFVAHISLEIMLDSLLLTEDIVVAKDFYNLLSDSNRESLDHFLRLNNINETEVFFNFYDEFLKAEYLNSYREAHNIMYAVNGICRRVWNDPLSETQRLQLTAVLIEYQIHLKKDFMQIFDIIDGEIN